MTTNPTTHRVTQVDLARAAEVSQATVSQILNETPDRAARVSEETRQRVLEAARRLGYATNAAARSLKGGRNQMVGLYTFEPVFPTDRQDFYFPFLLGVEDQGSALGFDILLFSSATRGAGGSSFDDITGRLCMADGCVLLGRSVDLDVLDRLSDMNYPFVFIGRREGRTGEIAYVAPDYRGATAKMLHELASAGPIRPLLVRQPGGDEPTQDRLGGFLDGCRELGISDPESWIVDQVPSAHELVEWVARGVNAILVEPTEDDTALVELEAALVSAGLHAPDDLSIACLGDPHLIGTTLEWTRIRIPREELGRAAVSLLSQILDGDVVNHRQLMDCAIVAGATHKANERES